MHDYNEVLAVLEKLAAEHPGKYTSGKNTPHKVEAGIGYSYDDCIAGCVIRELEPDLHERLLRQEKISGPFGLPRSDYSHKLPVLREVDDAFESGAYDLMRYAQMSQDSGNTWPNAVEYAKDRA